MNIAVCVKQVPDTTEIKIDPVKNTLIRTGVPSILNPYDGYALEAAARIKDANPGTKIVVLSMGPDQAKTVLRECLAINADKAYLIGDRIFAGSDTLATSYIISEAIKKVEETEGRFDLIFCGKQAIDGDTAQVGPEIAEHLDYPQITYGLEAEVREGVVRVKKETEGGAEIIEAELPAVVTFTKPSWEPRLPSIKRLLASRRAGIDTVSGTDMPDIERDRVGLNGSPTKVKKTFVPPRPAGGIKIEGVPVAEGTRQLFRMLTDANMI